MNPQYENQVDRACRSKRAYASEETARGVLTKVVRDGKVRVDDMLVYRCRFCAFFHVGHRVARSKRLAS